MKYLPLLWSGLWRKPIRTVLTVLSIAVAFLLFGVLQGVITGFEGARAKLSVNAGEKDDRVFANELYFNYEYLDEARATGKGTVHQYVVAIDDANRASEISQAIDRLFANSGAETATLNEREYVVAQLRQVGDVQMFVNSIIGAVLFTLLFLAGNTMSQWPMLSVMATSMPTEKMSSRARPRRIRFWSGCTTIGLWL